MTADTPIYILDSFAMLAYLQAEAGMARVQTILGQAEQAQVLVKMSLINLGEVLYLTERHLGLPQAQAVLTAIEQLPTEILPASRQAVLAAAYLKASYRISYADAFAAAAAQQFSAILLTGDPEFTSLQHLIQVEWLVC